MALIRSIKQYTVLLDMVQKNIKVIIRKMNIDSLKIKEFIDSFVGREFPDGAGSSFGIIDKGELVLNLNYGFSDIENTIKCNIKTNYRLASVTKQFTAVCILQLVDEGKVSLQDRISLYFPDFVNGDKISLYNLLTHTSGLPHFEELLNTNGESKIQDYKVFSILSNSRELIFTPGEEWDYNNGAYCILKVLLEKISKQSFEHYIIDNIFMKIGMKDSFFMSTRASGKNRAYGYEISDNRLLKNDYNSGSFTLGDGGIYSSIEDLSKWVVHRKKILSQKLFKESCKGLEFSQESGKYYGYGQNIIKCGEENFLIHAGYTQGFRSSICSSTSGDFGIIFLSNFHNNSSSEDYGSKITEGLLKFIKGTAQKGKTKLSR